MVTQIMIEKGRGMIQTMPTPDVLTLEEVADYLRVPQEAIKRQAMSGNIPGRMIEDTWRFLKAAIDDWLRTHDSRTILLQQAWAMSDDSMLSELRDNIYRARNRPEAEQDDD